ncbi:MAG: hypothetical protein DRP45_00315 [Candidatus Zixiibacteriota bacterium]|nr:MAG: hypothetical protein DRP45_00315 [candidate division Zixibacteria bacterium]
MVGNGKRLLAGVVVFVLGILLLPMGALGASTGQIKGQIVSEKSGEPIIGASVLIVGTTMGAQTDLDGRYAILGLEPATYTLRISHIESYTVEVTDVSVSIDKTTEINQKMRTKVTELDETITVIGARDVLDITDVTSQVVITADEIETMPVQSVDALLEQVAGVHTTAEGDVFIRGGRAGEVAYIVDGVPIGDPLGGQGQIGANLSLVSGSISEIQIIKDGFDPEYGNALSGIVNIRSNTGSKDNTNVKFQYITDDLGNADLNKYSQNYDFCMFSISGPDPLLSDKVLPALGLNVLKDQEFTYYVYGEVSKTDGFYPMSNYDTPATSRNWSSINLLGFEIPQRAYDSYHFQTNLKFRPRQNLKFIFSYKRWYSKWTAFSWDYRYSYATAPVRSQNRHSMSLEVTQEIARNMFYELNLSVLDTHSDLAPGNPDHPGKTIPPDEFSLDSEWETYTDVNQNGIYDRPEPLINLFPDTAANGDPQYTYGEFNTFIDNVQGGGAFFYPWYFNDNGIIDNLESEPFIDLNGNGVWDAGDVLHDRNGNGVLDVELYPIIDRRTPEPYVDGDSIIGEPFTDVNSNRVYDPGIDIFFRSPDLEVNQDLNHNGYYDGPNDPWDLTTPFEDRNRNGIYDPPNGQYDPGEQFTDENGNGRYDYGGTASFLDRGNHDVDAVWEDRQVRTYRGELKITRQMGRHELKGGCFFQIDSLSYGRIERPYLQYTGSPDTLNLYSERGAFRDFYTYAPTSGAVYFRDKIEYGSMIASLGLRWDFFLQDADELAATLRADDRGGTVQGDRQKFSPRIGFSYPISDKAKVYFNYGHFFQLPSFVWMYARNTSSVNQNDIVGNPNLDYQKTIQYSFGVKYKITPTYTIDIEGYFKDEFDKINQGQVLQNESIYINQYLNKDYGRSRGFEVTLEKRGGSVNGSVSYAYAFAYGKDSQTNENFMEEFLLSRQPLTESPLDHDIRHSLRAGIQIYMSTTAKPRLFGVPIPNGWSFSLQTIINSGKPFTPTSAYPGISQTGLEDIENNSMRYPGTAVFDVRFQKEFTMAGLDWEGIMWVENIFNSRNVDDVYENTGRADTQQNQNQVIKGGTEYDRNPYNWGYPRQIRLGLGVNF